MLTNDHVKELLKPIDPSRVSKDGKGFSHVEAWDVRKRMNQIFGFGKWSSAVEDMILIAEKEVTTRQGKPAWYVVYRAKCSVRVGDTFPDACEYVEWAAGDATNPVLGDAHDQAIKTAESQAFKRCCVNLGDQFGLSLYRDGSLAATVGEVVGQEHADTERIPEMLEALDAAASWEDLDAAVRVISGADVSSTAKQNLRNRYTDARSRLEAALGPQSASGG